jgi:hypothetical protein
MATSTARSLKYREEMTSCEDYDLWERAAASGQAMTNVAKVLLRYRSHPAQASQRHRMRQAELTRAVSLRAWTRFLSVHGADVGLAADVVDIRRAGSDCHDMERIHLAFRLLLASTRDEARLVALDHIRRLYFRLVGRHPEALERWAELRAHFGGPGGFSRDWAMTLVAALRLHPERQPFQRAKVWYRSWLE